MSVVSKQTLNPCATTYNRSQTLNYQVPHMHMFFVCLLLFLDVSDVREMSATDCDQEKEQDSTGYTLHNQTQLKESRQCKVPWSRVDREPPLGKTHPVNDCKS